MEPIGKPGAVLVGMQRNPVPVLPEQGGVFFVVRAVEQKNGNYVVHFRGAAGLMSLETSYRLEPGTQWLIRPNTLSAAKGYELIELSLQPPSLGTSVPSFPQFIAQPKEFWELLLGVLQELFLPIQEKTLVDYLARFHQVKPHLRNDWYTSIPLLRFIGLAQSMETDIFSRLDEQQISQLYELFLPSEPGRSPEDVLPLLTLFNTLFSARDKDKPYWQFYPLYQRESYVGLLQLYHERTSRRVTRIQIDFFQKSRGPRTVAWDEPRRQDIHIEDFDSLIPETRINILTRLRDYGFLDIVALEPLNNDKVSFSFTESSSLLGDMYG